MVSRIFVVDDHPMMRRGYASLINGEDDLSVVGQAGAAAEALVRVPEAKPDLLITDIYLGGMNGIELVRQLKSFLPSLNVLVVSMHDELLYAERALEVGAMGYVMKTSSDEEILEGIRRVLAGHYHLSPQMEDRLLHRLVTGSNHMERQSPLDGLSNRQLEVLELIGHGLSTAQIAERLYISPKTVETHTAGIKQKLGLRSATELLRYSVQWVETV